MTGWTAGLLPIALALGTVTPVRAAGRGAPAAAPAPAPDRAFRVELGRKVGKDLRAFYAARGNRPLWIGPGRQPGGAATILLGQIATAELDGLQARKLKSGNLKEALEKARSGELGDVVRAELSASQAYVRYVQALRKLPPAPMIYETPALAPAVPTATAALQKAAGAKSLVAHLQDMGWMHPFYARLRAALGKPGYSTEQRRILALNRDRARALPAIAGGRWVLVDAAAGRLWMYDGNRQADTMKVVVGKPETQTPAMAGFLRYAIVNPYWNLPDDLMPSRVTEPVLGAIWRLTGFRCWPDGRRRPPCSTRRRSTGRPWPLAGRPCGRASCRGRATSWAR